MRTKIRMKIDGGKRGVLSETIRYLLGGRTFKIDFGVIKEEDFDLASVVGIDDAGARVDEVLDCEPAAGGYATVYGGMRRSQQR